MPNITTSAHDFAIKSRASTCHQVNPWYKETQKPGLNYRLCHIQAVLGECQAKLALQLIERRKQITRTYNRDRANLRYSKTAHGNSATSRIGCYLRSPQIDYADIGHTRLSFIQALGKPGSDPECRLSCG